MNHDSRELPNDEMQRRRITLEDGRYLLFYTFGDETPRRAADAPLSEPEVKPEASEERRV